MLISVVELKLKILHVKMAKIVGTTQFMNERLQDEIPIFKKVRTYIGTAIYM